MQMITTSVFILGKGAGVNSLFQDLHVLSLIWTHPWCLKLAQLCRNKVNIYSSRYATVQKFGASKIFFKDIIAFIQQGFIKLIKRQ